MFCPRMNLQHVELPEVTRRLAQDSEVEVTADIFGQPIDIDLSLQHGVKELPNMPGYPRRSIGAALNFVNECLKVGIDKFLIRIVDGGDTSRDTSYGACLDRIQRQADAIHILRLAYPEPQMFIDPFGLALGERDQWGATSNGVISASLTEQMFAQAVKQYAQVGSSYILTLGRFPKEVVVARQVLNSIKSSTRLCGFSTNQESTQAYAYLPTVEDYKDSLQKVKPQNINEMLLWALVDIMSGSDMIIIKPADNLHLLLRLMQLAQCTKDRKQFLQQPLIQDLVAPSEFLSQMVDKLLVAKALEFEVGTYGISGVYANDQALRLQKGERFYLQMLFERFVQIIGTAAFCNKKVLIFDRSVSVYASAD